MATGFALIINTQKTISSVQSLYISLCYICAEGFASAALVYCINAKTIFSLIVTCVSVCGFVCIQKFFCCFV